jgi:citrate lyase beta subunit
LLYVPGNVEKMILKARDTAADALILDLDDAVAAEQKPDARALVAAASGGAERFRDRMIETMHVEMAKRLLARLPGA